MLKKQRKGFSLIELIVAIAILATMLLVLTPATLKYVDESRTAKDLKTTADFLVNSIIGKRRFDYFCEIGSSF